MAPQAKHWCYTSFNMEIEPLWLDNVMEYMVYQKEMAPTTGQQHWQGYVCFKKKRSLNWLKGNVDSTAHWVICKGTPAQNYEYCTKLDTRVEGSLPVVYGIE